MIGRKWAVCTIVEKIISEILRWRVSKLIFVCAQNDYFQNGIPQSQIVASGRRNYLSLVKGVCWPSFDH